MRRFWFKAAGHLKIKNDEAEFAVKFDSLNKYSQIQLDEIIKSRVMISENPSIAIEDGEYTLLLCPKKRTLSIRNKMRMIK